MVVTRTIRGFSGASVSVGLSVVLFITIPGTYSIVVVSWTASLAAVAVSGMLLKMVLLIGGSALSVLIFLF